MTPEDVERLMADPRVIRNRRKIEAIIDNAGKIAELDASYGGFDKYLRAQGSYEKTAAALKHDFSFWDSRLLLLGDGGREGARLERASPRRRVGPCARQGRGFLGDSTVYFFLAMVAEPVPDWEEHQKQHPGRQAHEKTGAAARAAHGPLYSTNPSTT